jgi:hypothetical protein
LPHPNGYHPKAGEVIAYVRGSNGDQLVFTRTDEEGMDWGYIYSPEHNRVNDEMYIAALGKYLDFEAIPGKELYPAEFYGDDEEDEDLN